MEKLQTIIRSLEQLAPPSYQESYDNAGLITGSPDMQIKGALICLDSTEEIIDEAIKRDCNLVIAHHPILFTGLKKINGKNYFERAVIKAIKNDIAIYAIHTNLDNVANGVNRMICERLGILNPRILAPKQGTLQQLITYCPVNETDKIKNALFAAGAGSVGNYDECSFTLEGTGTFRGNEFSNPVLGKKGERHHEKESRIEVIFESFRQNEVMRALREAHPYEEVAYYIHSLDNQDNNIGSGMIGELPESMSNIQFLSHLKAQMGAGCVRYTNSRKKEVRKVAVCGGSGSFLLANARKSGADAFITADFKYHQFFDAEGEIIIADIGHYESEQFTKELILNYLNGKFTTFALRLSEFNTNPVNYF